MKRAAAPLSRLAELCKAKGVGITRPRRAILAVLEGAAGHLAADEVYRLAKKKEPSIGQATVYRTLKLLGERGIISASNFGQPHSHFEAAGGHHDHFVCSGCGAIIEFVDPRLEALKEEVARRHRFEPSGHHLEIHGLCRECAARKARRGKKKPPGAGGVKSPGAKPSGGPGRA